MPASTPSRVNSIDEKAKDEALLATLGYKQEFKRDFGLFEVFGVAFALVGQLLSLIPDSHYSYILDSTCTGHKVRKSSASVLLIVKIHLCAQLCSRICLAQRGTSFHGLGSE